MTRLVHLTDLHFGCERADLVAPLTDAIRGAGPDLVVVTGDLTHRGRRHQFRSAVAFLNGLGLPYVTMPGNHDVPLFNLFLRILSPFGNWRREVGTPLAPQRAAGRALIVAANTADPSRVRRGRLRPGDLAAIGAGLRSSAPGVIPLLACHHPFEVPPGFEQGETRGAAEARPGLIRDGLQVILSGHLHAWKIGLGITATAGRPLLLVETGTALCARPGERDHGFSVLDLGPENIAVTPWLVSEPTAQFGPGPRHSFVRRDGLWYLGPTEAGPVARCMGPAAPHT